jgi:CubicO group peptidase (beta-lactamase class C family)
MGSGINSIDVDGDGAEDTERFDSECLAGISRRRLLRYMGAGIALGVLDPQRFVNSAHAARWLPTPHSRVWRATGTNPPDITPYDDMFQTFMKRYGVRAASFALSKDGALLYSRGYTWAESLYPATLPGTLFRLASVSKAFTNAAIFELSSAGRLNLATPVFPFLGITDIALASQTPSPYINEITVQNLLDMAGGWNDHQTVVATDGTTVPGTGFDPLFNLREIAQKLRLFGPPSKRDVARYMYGEPLQFEPGTQDVYTTAGESYSNFGYLLLGMVIEAVTGTAYIRYVQQLVRSLGITDLQLGHTAHSLRYPKEVWSYDSPDKGPSAFFPYFDVEAPFPYGGDDFLLEVGDSAGGLVTSAPSLVTFTHKYISWGFGYRPDPVPNIVVSRNGGLPGARSYIVNSDTRVDYAFVMNTGNFPGAIEGSDPVSDLFTQLENYILGHLF